MVVVPVEVYIEGGLLAATWGAMDNGDTGAPVEVPFHANISVQCIAGTIGTSTLEGSNDGVAWGALGAGLTIAASNAVSDVPVKARYLRPSVGAGGTDAEVVLVATVVR
jgi:hypothetical protein